MTAEIPLVADIVRQALLLACVLSAALIVPSFVVGLLAGVFQSLTSLQDQLLSFAPKLLVSALMVYLLSTWMVQELSVFMDEIFRLAVRLSR